MQKNKSTIIFDFDGTIADTLPFTYMILKTLAKKYKIVDLTPQEFDRYRSKSPLQAVKDYKIPFYKLPFLLREGQQMLAKEMDKVGFVKGMKEVLVKLKEKGYRLAILSSNSKKNIEAFLKKEKMNQIFDFIHSEKSLFGKDKSLNHIIKNHQLDKQEILYVGDEVRDVEACNKIGVDIVAVTWGFNTKTILKENNPQFVINKPEELIKLL